MPHADLDETPSRTAVESCVRGDALPRIEVLPVVLRGKYDEHNWRVLRERWDDLRAQLHGEVIPPRHIGPECTEEEMVLLAELSSEAPDFSPGASWRTKLDQSLGPVPRLVPRRD